MRTVEGRMPAMHLFCHCCGFLLLHGIVHSAAKTNPSVKGQHENEGVYYHSTPKEPYFHFSTTPVTAWSTLQCAVHCTSLKQTGFVMQKHLCQCITKRGITGTDTIKIKEGSKVYIKG
ncbi:hypothetical protein ACJMK2_021165 [Sinanodonta woodiana]|uniref:Secreted protein n=1 Tax=Sinanodonta woodiana TaxID=1069815 RepID=A0ABD3U467_SINWO